MTAQQTVGEDATALGRRPTDLQQRLGFRLEFVCPVCGDGNADATWRLTRDGSPDWVIGCFSATCRDLGGAYLGDLAETLNLNRGATKAEIVAALPDVRATAIGRRGQEQLPLALGGWEVRLWADRRALAYLRGRGLADETIRRAGIGYGSFHGRPLAFMLPVRNRIGGLLTVKERYWPELWIDPKGKPQKSRTLAGRGSHLYPALGDAPNVVLCAGEIDALTLGQELQRAGIEGVQAVSATSGTQVRAELLQELKERTVAVVFDVGEEDEADRVSARLRLAGADAWAVRIPLPRRGDDINLWLTSYRRSARELCQVIRRARRSP